MDTLWINYSEISQSLVRNFFRIFDNREKYLTVCDDNGYVLGFLTLKEAALFLQHGTIHLLDTLPVRHPNNFHSYQIALSILPVYVGNFKDYLECLEAQFIGIDANVADYNYIKSYMEGLALYRVEDNPQITFDIVIILRCPLPMQDCLFGSAKKVNISDLFESFLLEDFLRFVGDNNLQAFFIEGPIANKLKDVKKYKYIQSRISLEEILKDKEYMEKFFCLGDRNQIDYIYNPQYGVLCGNSIITDGISLRSGYYNSQKLNVSKFGERKSLANTKTLSVPDIFIYGSCLTFGIFTEDDNTFPSNLQQLINDSTNVTGVVHNMGVKGKALLINDLLLAMQSEVKPHDILIFVSPISSYSIKILEKNNIVYFDFSEYLNKHSNVDCCFLNNAYHANVAVYKELAKFSYALISKHQRKLEEVTNSLGISGFVQNGKQELFDCHYMWQNLFLKDYLLYLDSLPRPTDEAIVGSILITANPFTLGHVSLIQKSLKLCDYLYIFVVKTDAFKYTYSQRMEMVKRYCKSIPNCCVATSGDIWGSKELFPEYFNRNYQNHEITISTEHAHIFGNYIAPKLRISKRFVGNENRDRVTMQYNQYLEKNLPVYGIDVVIFERQTDSLGVEIHASLVRELIEEKGIDHRELLNFLPITTIEVIKDLQ